jgi:hypothetical protein
MRTRLLFLLLLLTVSLAPACGGSNGNGSSSSSTTSSTPPPSQNPCAAALSAEDEPPLRRETVPGPKNGLLGDDAGPYKVLNELWKHRSALRRGQVAPDVQGATAEDIGEIAVIQDERDLILPANAFDLKGLGLRFTPNASGGYDVARIDAAFRSTLGPRLTLGDDDSVERGVPFTFTAYGRSQTRAFVNSDGNITFEQADSASTSRDVSRLLTGPPRVAPFFADLDPSAGGRVFLQAASDQFTVTWCSVRGFDSLQTATVQTSLLPNGTIEMKFDQTIALTDTVVGVSPGRTGDFTPVDLSASGTIAGGAAAVGERFAANPELDMVALIRRFYQSHPDAYDQLVIWTDQRLANDAFAYEITVANDIRGIGIEIYDTSGDFGSAGRLESFAMMDLLTRYPADPAQQFLGEDTTLSLVAHESAHRWLAFLRFRDLAGQISPALLGRQLAHWSFFFDSDASVMEGNDIEDLGGGSFRTVGAVRRYSALDQYAMGLRRESEVPPFFYVESPLNVVPPQQADSNPRTGVTFNGTRRELLLQDVINALGVRQPAFDQAPKVHRQAYIYLVSAGRALDRGQVEKVDRIRLAFTDFYFEATDRRGRVETSLRP